MKLKLFETTFNSTENENPIKICFPRGATDSKQCIMQLLRDLVV